MNFLKTAFLIFCLLFLGGWRNPFDTPAERNREANELYRQKNYDLALKKYSDAQLAAPNSPKLHYNLGTAFFRKKDFNKAASEFQTAVTGSKEDSVKTDSLYNLGNAFFQLKKYQEAVKSYEQVLKLNSQDREARHNLEVARRLLEEQKKQESHDHKDDQKKDKNQDKKDKKNKDRQDKKENNKKTDSQDKSKQSEQKNQQKKKDPEKKQKKDKNLKNDKKDSKQENKPAKPVKKGQMSPEEAARILDALKNEELKFQRKRLKTGSDEVEVEKDW
ncbi:MAG: tetratricopeptide repeat protein [bacterium]